MTKFSLPALLFAFVLIASCKKSSSSSNSGGGTLTATVDGTPMTFNNILAAKDTSYMGAYAITFGGITALSSGSPELSLTVDGATPITTGTYTLSSSGNTANLPAIAYTQGSTLIYESDVSGTYASTITITALSKTNVQGTFTGTLTLMVGSGSATKSITNGKFNVNFK